MDVLDKVGERVDQTSGYGERLLDGGLTEGHPMKLEVAGIPPASVWHLVKYVGWCCPD